jgi:hypothetical protein
MPAPVRLLPIPEAASLLGVPEKSLLREAERHGHLVRVGRAVRIMESELGELIEKCRSQPKVPASCSESAQDASPSTSSRIAVSQSVARAQQIADKLKSCSQTTSRGKAAEVVRLPRKK